MGLRFCFTNGSSGSSDGVGLRMISCLSFPLFSTTVLDFSPRKTHERHTIIQHMCPRWEICIVIGRHCGCLSSWAWLMEKSWRFRDWFERRLGVFSFLIYGFRTRETASSMKRFLSIGASCNVILLIIMQTSKPASTWGLNVRWPGYKQWIIRDTTQQTLP